MPETKTKKPPTKGKPAGKSTGKMGGAVAFLKRKEMGLPVWAWGLIIAVAVFILYRRFKGHSPASTSANSANTNPTGAGDFGSSTGDSGGGSGSSTPDNSSDPLAELASELGARGAFGYGSSPLQLGQGLDTSSLGPTPFAVNLPGSKVLNWAGVNFTTQAQFDAYLKSHGLTVKTFAARHPAAYKIYSNLAKGTPLTKKGLRKNGAGTTGAATAGKHKHVSAPNLVSEHGKLTSTSVNSAVAPVKRSVATGLKKAPTLVSEHGKIPTPTKTTKTTSKPRPAPTLVSEHGRTGGRRATPPRKPKSPVRKTTGR